MVRRLVGDAPADRLADPPRGVGGELEALAVVELLHRPHQPEVALLDEVEQRHPGALVALGDRHDEAQVGLDEGAAGRLGGADLAVEERRAGPGGLVDDSSISASRPVSMAWASSTSCSAVEQGVGAQLAQVAASEVDRALALVGTVAPGHRILRQRLLDLRARSLIDGSGLLLKGRGWSGVANRPFGALKEPRRSADMTHQKGPPATTRGVSWGRCGGTEERDQPASPRRPTEQPAPATDRRAGHRGGPRPARGDARR